MQRRTRRSVEDETWRVHTYRWAALFVAWTMLRLRWTIECVDVKLYRGGSMWRWNLTMLRLVKVQLEKNVYVFVDRFFLFLSRSRSLSFSPFRFSIGSERRTTNFSIDFPLFTNNPTDQIKSEDRNNDDFFASAIPLAMMMMIDKYASVYWERETDWAHLLFLLLLLCSFSPSLSLSSSENENDQGETKKEKDVKKHKEK